MYTLNAILVIYALTYVFEPNPNKVNKPFDLCMRCVVFYVIQCQALSKTCIMIGGGDEIGAGDKAASALSEELFPEVGFPKFGVNWHEYAESVLLGNMQRAMLTEQLCPPVREGASPDPPPPAVAAAPPAPPMLLPSIRTCCHS